MSVKFDSHIHIRTCVQILNHSRHSGGCCEGFKTEEKSTMSHEGRRQALVQTEFGYVKAKEMDCMDSVQHSVKRRLLPAFDVPTDRNNNVFKFSTMILGDNNGYACHLSSNGKAIQQRDHRDCNVEILGQLNTCNKVNELVKEMVKAIKNAVDPVPVNGGLGGAYCFTNCNGEPIAIVKPTDEEPFAPNNPKGFIGKAALGLSGVMRSVRIGETGYREVAAYILDHGHFSKVPPTALVKISHPIFNVNESGFVSKVASLQQFISHDVDASDHGTSSFPVSAVHRIGILDIRIFNTDRHAGNILVRKRLGEVELIPIDHGLCLPESLEDPYFEWMYWPQASIPFSEIEREYIKKLDPLRDCEMLRLELPMIREACLRILVLCTTFLKQATDAGLCLSEIGQIMSREYRYPKAEPSELELLCTEAKRVSLRNEDMDNDQLVADLCLQVLDTSAYELPSCVEEKHTNVLSPDIKTAQYVGKEGTLFVEGPSRGELSQSRETKCLFQRSRGKHDSMVVSPSSVLRRSATELHSMPTGFVSVADMSHEEWSNFLTKFQRLLGHSLANRKSSSIIGPKQRHRLGSSCQF